jgi:hypothetical protein
MLNLLRPEIEYSEQFFHVFINNKHYYLSTSVDTKLVYRSELLMCQDKCFYSTDKQLEHNCKTKHFAFTNL